MMPNIPTTLQSFLQMKDSLPANLLTAYHGHFRTADNEIGLVFTSQQLLGAIKHWDTTKLFIDGTFAPRPKEPTINAQLLIMHVQKRDVVSILMTKLKTITTINNIIKLFLQGIPVMFVLCESKTKTLYKAFWSYVSQHVPEVHR
ncbi:hypothetical protein PV325_006784 [Microctonus aethiopoides]|uniref:Uncharacterized protein n=1 Tax=Microctonus aethiopoides TaxID=144406 RepID=A0AA39FX94_9HYME|nr:hypothetical protein PV325_006784 [Microctonus aethiopoides]KAK0177226.1 hypothetical protein PV328_001302 [Microctonus aethiopoides]